MEDPNKELEFVNSLLIMPSQFSSFLFIGIPADPSKDLATFAKSNSPAELIAAIAAIMVANPAAKEIMFRAYLEAQKHTHREYRANTGF